MIHYIHTLSTVLVENLTDRATIRDADASNVINKFSLLEERLSRADVWMTFYKNTSNLQATISPWRSPVSPSSSPTTTAARCATTGRGPVCPSVSRPSARSCLTPPGTGWWWPPTSSTAWWASSSAVTATC